MSALVIITNCYAGAVGKQTSYNYQEINSMEDAWNESGSRICRN